LKPRGATSSSLVYDGRGFLAVVNFSRGETLSGRGKYLRASEVAEYVYCARAWRLRADGHEPASGHRRRAEGETWHLAHGREVVRAQRMHLVAKFAFLVALFVGLLLLALLRWR
jgi:hypothetical protein